jgi:tripartite-type tricarboxylate transporter receptor subunit TctC
MIHRRCLLPAAAAWLTVASAARAQAWPSRAIRLVTPYPAGGPTDILGRAVALRMGDALGQPMVVDNKPGASGNIGSDLVAKAAPDGHTLVVGNNATHATNQSLFPQMPYDAAQDFAAVGLMATVTHVLVVHPDLPATTIELFVRLVGTTPGKLNYASTGNGSASHLTMELFKEQMGLKMEHVPYRGSAPAVQDLLSDQVNCSFQTLPSVLAQIQAGKLRALAVTSKRRHPQLPGVPTVAESVIPAFESDAWFGLFAPAGTPPDIVARLNAELLKALADATTREAVVRAGFDVRTSSPAELAAFVKAEIVKWAKVVKASGAKLD